MPVPNFVIADEWEYTRPLNIETLSAFDATAAETSAAANGFYLFHAAA